MDGRDPLIFFHIANCVITMQAQGELELKASAS